MTTLSTIAVFPVDVTLVSRAAQTESDGGAVVRRRLRSSASRYSGKYETRVWRLTFGPTDEAALLATWDAALGSALPVLWTPPPPDEAAEIEVRFVENSLRIRKGPGAMYEAEVELEEVT